eukprot:763089-Hanusia_phi.AAC.5
MDEQREHSTQPTTARRVPPMHPPADPSTDDEADQHGTVCAQIVPPLADPGVGENEEADEVDHGTNDLRLTVRDGHHFKNTIHTVMPLENGRAK